LWTIFNILALITEFSQFGLMIDRDRAKITGFNAPGTTITLGRVDADDARFGVLRQGIAGAGCNTGCVFAGAASHSRDQNLIHSNRADSAAV